MKTDFKLYSDGSVHIRDARVTEPVTFAHVTDLHLHPEPPSLWPEEYRDAIEWWDLELDRPSSALPRLLDRIQAEDVDFVFFGGDILDHYDPSSASHVVSLCAQRGLDAYFQIGNHDWETEYVRYVTHQVDLGLRKEMGARLCEHWGMPGLYYSFERKGVKFVSLDTPYIKTESGFQGFFDDDRTAWLIDQLEYDGPIIAFHHVPFDRPGFEYRIRAIWGGIRLCLAEDENGRTVLRALEDCPNLLGTFTGHLHLASEDPLGERCQFVTSAASQGYRRYVRIANDPAPKSLRQEGIPTVALNKDELK